MCKLFVTALLVLPLGLSPSTVGIPRPSVHSEKLNGVDWQRMALRDEEFSMLTPTQPSGLVQSDGYWLSDGGEKVLSHRAYSGYADGFIFVVESYKAARPQRLLKDVDHMFRNLGRVQLEPSENTNFAGAKKYTLGRNNFVGNVYVFATRQHVYVVIVAAKAKDHPSFNRFLSSFTVSDSNSAPGTILPKLEDDSVAPGAFPGGVLGPKEATTKAIVVWKPEPTYTQAARMNQRTGTVVLKGTFTSSGQVIITDVIKTLKDGLTERAIAAAKNIKFFPAEKDGQPVSVSLQLEYNFNLY